ncbi:hypothetical protein ACSLNR_29155, partial [Escherichia coli]
MVYASRVKKNPLLSRVHESDRFFREKQADVEQRPFTFGDWLVKIATKKIITNVSGIAHLLVGLDSVIADIAQIFPCTKQSG